MKKFPLPITVGENDIVGNETVVRSVRLAHEEVPIADHRGRVLLSAARDCTVLAEQVGLADADERTVPLEMRVLWIGADDDAIADLVVGTDLGPPCQPRMRAD